MRARLGPRRAGRKRSLPGDHKAARDEDHQTRDEWTAVQAGKEHDRLANSTPGQCRTRCRACFGRCGRMTCAMHQKRTS
eukprot:2180578-Rhodomonas_salina.3